MTDLPADPAAIEAADAAARLKDAEPRPGWATGPPLPGPLTDEQIATLNEPLDQRRVKKREGRGGGQFSYLEGHDVKRTLTRIFGFGQWGYRPLEVVELEAVPVKNRKGNAGWHVGYRATVELTVRGCIPVADVGYGDGVEYGYGPEDSGSSRVTAQELAIKESVTDGLKRAAVAFGDQFGLVLYEKDEGAARQRRDQHADEASSRPPSDTPMSIKACMERLAFWVLAPLPWVKEAYLRLYDEELAGTEAQMDTSRRHRMIQGLQNVGAYLDANAPKPSTADATAEAQAAYLAEMQAAVRAAFALAFDGREILGPEPFAPAIPF